MIVLIMIVSLFSHCFYLVLPGEKDSSDDDDDDDNNNNNNNNNAKFRA